MAKRASGKYAYLIDDRSGRKIRYKDARTEWNGLRVHKKDWEPKHPQLTPPKLGPEATSLYNPRPDADVDLTTVKLGSLFGRGTPNTVASVGKIIINVSELAESPSLLRVSFILPILATGVTASGVGLSSAIGSVNVSTAENADSQLLQAAFTIPNISVLEEADGLALSSAFTSPTPSASSSLILTGQSSASAHGGTGLAFNLTELPVGQQLSTGIGSLTFQTSSQLAITSPANTTGIGTINISAEEDVGGLSLTSAHGTISISIDSSGWGIQTWGQNVWGT
tara:strand:- start:2024 stop:2869 length:846 start_codon:yes stop_codon:yes gene_type:complete